MLDEPTKRVTVDLPLSVKEEIAKIGLPYRAVMMRGLDTIKNSATVNDEITEMQRQIANFYKQNQRLVEQIQELRLRQKGLELLPVITEAQAEYDRKMGD